MSQEKPLLPTRYFFQFGKRALFVFVMKSWKINAEENDGEREKDQKSKARIHFLLHVDTADALATDNKTRKRMM